MRLRCRKPRDSVLSEKFRPLIRSFDGLLLDLLSEYWREDLDEEEGDAEDPEDDTPEAEIFWRVRIEYADETEQDIVSYQDYLFVKPAELLFVLSEYFQSDANNSDGDFDKDQEQQRPER